MALQLKGSHIPGVIPAVNELEERELAVNTKDGKLYTKTPDGIVIEIGADTINTGLETPTPDGGIHSGHRYINNTDPADYLPLGTDATDLTYSSGSNPGSASIGAGGVGSFTAGIDATATGTNSFALGNNSRSSGDDSFAIGNNNNIQKNLSFGIGTDLIIDGPLATIGSFTIGRNNTISGDGSVAIGVGNSNPYNNAVTIGSGNEILLSNTFAIGENLQTSNISGSVVLGKYNYPTNNKSLIIGSGTANTDRKNILELDATTGVLSLPQLNSVGNIQNNTDVITLGYLESYGNIVRSVNGYAGNVSLTVADIPEQAGVDRLWFTQGERDQIVSNTNAITTKEPLLPTASGSNLVLTVIDPATRTYDWKVLDNTSVSIGFSQLTDTPASYDVTNANQLVSVNGAGTALVFRSVDRVSDLNILPDGSSTVDPISGLSFELSTDPYLWGINQATYNYMQGEYGDRSYLGTWAPVDVTTGEKLPFSDAMNSLSGRVGLLSDLTTPVNNDIVSAINEVNSRVVSNTTNIGDLTTLVTVDKTSLVNAVNEVKGYTDTNTTNINNLQQYILGSGPTASRPTTTTIGAQYFDTDLAKPIWYDGNATTGWVDATGTAV